MSKDQKKEKNLTVENVENLKVACKMINDVITGIHYWNYDKIWPINLYKQSLEKISEMINIVIFQNDIVSSSHINDK